MYDIPNKILPSFEKKKEPVEEVRYTPENIWDNMPPEPETGSSDFTKFTEFFDEMIKRQKIIDLAKKVKDIPGTIVKKETDFFQKFRFFADIPDELLEEDCCGGEDCYNFYPEEDEVEEINSIKDYKDLIEYLKDKFPFDIMKK